jgi:hypothetical protein
MPEGILVYGSSRAFGDVEPERRVCHRDTNGAGSGLRSRSLIFHEDATRMLRAWCVICMST